MSISPIKSLPALTLLLCLAGFALPALGADAQRGQLLYENHCTVCHDSRAHVRDNRRARSLADVRGWVIRWSQHLALDWDEDERSDVATYLYDRYYTDSQ